MNVLSDTMRRAIGAPPPAEPDALKLLRAAIWKEVAQAERDIPRYQQILREQAEQMQAQGMLR